MLKSHCKPSNKNVTFQSRPLLLPLPPWEGAGVWEVWGDPSPAPAAAVCRLRACVPGMLQGAWTRAEKEADRADILGEQRVLVREDQMEREGWGFQSQGKHGKELIRLKTSFKFP